MHVMGCSELVFAVLAIARQQLHPLQYELATKLGSIFFTHGSDSPATKKARLEEGNCCCVCGKASVQEEATGVSTDVTR
eukprot:5474664-Amphidinium_carterae.2